MHAPLTIAPARPGDWTAVLDLVFQHLPIEQQRLRVANALNLLTSGDLVADGLLGAWDGDRLVGALVCLPLEGAGALFWPPQVVDGRDPASVADPLVRRALAWLDERGTKIAQAFVTSEELPFIQPLVRTGL